MSKKDLTKEEIDLLEAQIKSIRQKEAEEAARQEAERVREEKRLAQLAKEDAYLSQVKSNMKSLESIAGDLIHDTDFLWLMICLIFSSTDAGRTKPATNRFITNVVEAYKRSRGKS